MVQSGEVGAQWIAVDVVGRDIAVGTAVLIEHIDGFVGVHHHRHGIGDAIERGEEGGGDIVIQVQNLDGVIDGIRNEQVFGAVGAINLSVSIIGDARGRDGIGQIHNRHGRRSGHGCGLAANELIGRLGNIEGAGGADGEAGGVSHGIGRGIGAGDGIIGIAEPEAGGAGSQSVGGSGAARGHEHKPVIARIGHQQLSAGAGQLMGLIQFGEIDGADVRAADSDLAGQAAVRFGERVHGPNDLIAGVADGEIAVVEDGDALELDIRIGGDGDNGVGDSRRRENHLDRARLFGDEQVAIAVPGEGGGLIQAAGKGAVGIAVCVELQDGSVGGGILAQDIDVIVVGNGGINFNGIHQYGDGIGQAVVGGQKRGRGVRECDTPYGAVGRVGDIKVVGGGIEADALGIVKRGRIIRRDDAVGGVGAAGWRGQSGGSDMAEDVIIIFRGVDGAVRGHGCAVRLSGFRVALGIAGIVRSRQTIHPAGIG